MAMWLLVAVLLVGTLKLLSTLDVLVLPWLAQLSWWWIAGGFAAVALWWGYADSSGLTQRKAVERMDQRKADRLAKQKDHLRRRRPPQ